MNRTPHVLKRVHVGLRFNVRRCDSLVSLISVACAAVRYRREINCREINILDNKYKDVRDLKSFKESI